MSGRTTSKAEKEEEIKEGEGGDWKQDRIVIDLIFCTCFVLILSPNTAGPTWFNKCCEFQRVRMAMGRGVRMDISIFFVDKMATILTRR